MTEMSDGEEFREFLLDLLPKSQNKNIDEIVRYFEDYIALPIYSLHVDKTRIDVETVEAYGLTIRLDVNGRAAKVDSTDGFYTA